MRSTGSNSRRVEHLDTGAEGGYPLLGIAKRARRALEPVSPAPEFRARLHDSLLSAARHRDVGDLVIRAERSTPWGWVALVALAGALFVLVLRVRQRTRDQPLDTLDG